MRDVNTVSDADATPLVIELVYRRTIDDIIPAMDNVKTIKIEVGDTSLSISRSIAIGSSLLLVIATITAPRMTLTAIELRYRQIF